MSTSELHKGDAVAWQTSQGETHGKVVAKLTEDTQVKLHKVKASPQHPQYLVKSEKTGKKAAHKASALDKR
jgi:uncharacterized protein YijF (DUF1287 family)